MALLLAGLAVLVLGLAVAWGQRDSPSLPGGTVDGGGGASFGDGYLLIGTAGQPSTGTMSGGRYALAGGFWGRANGVSPFGLALYLPLVSASMAAEVRVQEVPNRRPVGEDPILVSGRLDPSVLEQAPDTPPEDVGEGAHDLMEETQWSTTGLAAVAAGQAQEIAVSFDQPVLLQTTAMWQGSAQAMVLQVIQGGQVLATGQAHPVPPNHGAVSASVEIAAAGTATVSVRNPTAAPVQVQIVVGTVPLSLRP